MASADGFKFWSSYYEALLALDTDKQRSDFMLGLCAYVFDGAEPEFDDPAVRFGFKLVADQAKRSMEISRAASEAGKRGGRPKSGTTERAAKSTPKRVAKRVVKRGAESVSELVGALATTNQPLMEPPLTVDAGGGLTPPPADDAPPPLP